MKSSGMPPQSFAGPSIIELAWEQMDEATAAVMEGDNSDKAKGRAIGMSQIIAIFVNPYDPKPKAIRTEAKRRWHERQEQ